MRGHAPTSTLFTTGDAIMPDGTSMAVPQARLAGGNSAINGSSALCGSLSDLEMWESLRNLSWGCESVLPVHQEIEDDKAGIWHSMAAAGRSLRIGTTRRSTDRSRRN